MTHGGEEAQEGRAHAPRLEGLALQGGARGKKRGRHNITLALYFISSSSRQGLRVAVSVCVSCHTLVGGMVPALQQALQQALPLGSAATGGSERTRRQLSIYE